MAGIAVAVHPGGDFALEGAAIEQFGQRIMRGRVAQLRRGSFIGDRQGKGPACRRMQ
jgi:hypothetical protein